MESDVNEFKTSKNWINYLEQLFTKCILSISVQAGLKVRLACATSEKQPTVIIKHIQNHILVFDCMEASSKYILKFWTKTRRHAFSLNQSRSQRLVEKMIGDLHERRRRWVRNFVSISLVSDHLIQENKEIGVHRAANCHRSRRQCTMAQVLPPSILSLF